MDEKMAQVSIDTDGNVLKCAKGLAGGECGFMPGAKVCAKCGAVPVEMKMVPVDDEDPFTELYEKAAAMAELEDDMMDEEDGMEADGEMAKKKAKRKGMMKPGMMGEDDEEDESMMMDEEDEEDESMKGYMGMGKWNEDEEKEYGMSPDGLDLEKMRKRRLMSLGAKSEEIGRNGYLCAVDRKVYPGGTTVCDDCPGGCVSEKGLPGLLHAEGIAEDMFKGEILDSGYSSDADMFVIDVESKSGKPIEVFIDGTTAEVLGWQKLDANSFEQKSAIDSMMLIDFNEAADIAVKSIQGEVIAVEPDIFEGFDAYAVEIDGIDGKSYDVFVSLDGEVLGYDKYEPEEAEDIEAEAAEIALKRAFSEDVRTQMAKEGTALPDGSYPIASVNDLKNAIQAYGRAKDKEATKRHIMKRARALGQEKLIPVNWVAGGKAMVEEKSGQTDDDFISSLLEFELLASEVDNNQDNA